MLILPIGLCGVISIDSKKRYGTRTYMPRKLTFVLRVDCREIAKHPNGIECPILIRRCANLCMGYKVSLS